MNHTGKYIGFNLKIPFQVVDAAMYRYLQSGIVSKEDILSHIREFTKGKNSEDKTTRYVMLIFKKQAKLLSIISKKMNQADYLLLSEQERKAMYLCLLALTFPITYDLLNILGSIFKLQDSLNATVITQRITLLYGSNRPVFTAKGALITMFLEIDKIKRIKQGLYGSQPPFLIRNSLITELILYTDVLLSGSKSVLYEDIKHRNFYTHFSMAFDKTQKGTLIKYKDLTMGQDYISIG